MSEIFISYSRSDRDFVDSLIAGIQQGGFEIWVDREDIRGGQAWRAAISRAIRACPAFIVILSPNSIKSRNVTKELDLADKHSKAIIPLLYQKCDIPPEIEYQIAGLQMVDFSIQAPQTALDELIQALGSREDLEQRSQLSQAEKRELTLAQVLPGTWQVQLNVPTPFGVVPGQMAIEIYPNGFFRGQSPAIAADGQWRVNQFNYLELSGRQTNGIQWAPYGVMIQFTQVNQQQLNGITSANETVFWQRV